MPTEQVSHGEPERRHHLALFLVVLRRLQPEPWRAASAALAGGGECRAMPSRSSSSARTSRATASSRRSSQQASSSAPLHTGPAHSASPPFPTASMTLGLDPRCGLQNPCLSSQVQVQSERTWKGGKLCLLSHASHVWY
ncbi:hypothetical protein BS78_06G031800 [Paspalum vaginatum]|nr:hypothetical protein BS78_06G031800 [Paspalum vaginatum]